MIDFYLQPELNKIKITFIIFFCQRFDALQQSSRHRCEPNFELDFN